MLRFIQLKLNHCRVAQDLLTQTIVELRIDVAILSEPHRTIRSNTWVADPTEKAAIWSCGQNTRHFSGVKAAKGYVRTKLNDLWVYSCYLPPSWSLKDFSEAIDNLVIDASLHSPAMVAGDFNAWATEWGSAYTNARGKIVVEAFASLDLLLLNAGSNPTFSRAGGQSIIDLTFLSTRLAASATWEISEAYTECDHRAIITTLNMQRSAPRISTRSHYKEGTLNIQTFRATLAGMQALEHEEAVMTKVKEACDASMQCSRRFNGHRPVYWWNQEIEEARRECISARRAYHRSRGNQSFLFLREIYTQKRKVLKKAIQSMGQSI
ncbi:uncharacterized protein [Drosophila takahashii]|uniref:uncharacterized protein n=1 Tax=Drosophila takahashii TaxID=29030 RepID=UPI003898F521